MNLESERSYLAACKLNIMLAHTVLNDDVKMENEGRRPPDVWLASSCILTHSEGSSSVPQACNVLRDVPI